MKMLAGYWRTLRAYCGTAKGGHDMRDYGKALLNLIGLIALCWLVLYLQGL